MPLSLRRGLRRGLVFGMTGAVSAEGTSAALVACGIAARR